ncbi:glutamine amidotransferase [Sulfobacillus thermosulfidooxidans]|uniref:glutamine amidotransferase n=1 Tax=Sulfobacillus thermosulfidooxidans TaxID=28034 RepID=UPI0006B4984B|nr:glutamine amidotransferase [Sulfobacillus thermosulfidooxidans]
MCGIAGIMVKSADRPLSHSQDIGHSLFQMLTALANRGPDSTGAAVDGDAGLMVTVWSDTGTFLRVQQILTELGIEGTWSGGTKDASALFHSPSMPSVDTIETLRQKLLPQDGVGVSASLRLMKVVGNPKRLNALFGMSAMQGTVAIGHTRMATESHIDLAHTQPFSMTIPAVTIVHNGHITNYEQWRRRLMRRDFHFQSVNDSEVIAAYLSYQLSRGLSLKAALDAMLIDLDGSYSVLALTNNEIGYVRDGFGFKPLVIAESDRAVFIASESQAIRQLGVSDLSIHEAWPGEARTWITQPMVLWN